MRFPQRSKAGGRPAFNVSTVLFAVFSIAYPLIAVLLVKRFGPWPVMALLAGLLILRGIFGLGARIPMGLTAALLAVFAGMAGLALFDPNLAVRLYPALMNAAMLCAFGYSLCRPPSMIERFARIAEPDLPESGVRYTRAATFAWVIFFALNGAAATWTALYASWEVWSLYNGVLAYAGMGALFLGEWLVRGHHRKRAGQHS